MSIVTSCFARARPGRRHAPPHRHLPPPPRHAGARPRARRPRRRWRPPSSAPSAAAILLVIGKAAFGVGIGAGRSWPRLAFVLGALCCCARGLPRRHRDPHARDRPARRPVRDVPRAVHLRHLVHAATTCRSGCGRSATPCPSRTSPMRCTRRSRRRRSRRAIAPGDLAAIAAWGLGAAWLASRRFSWLPSTAADCVAHRWSARALVRALGRAHTRRHALRAEAPAPRGGRGSRARPALRRRCPPRSSTTPADGSTGGASRPRHARHGLVPVVEAAAGARHRAGRPNRQRGADVWLVAARAGAIAGVALAAWTASRAAGGRPASWRRSRSCSRPAGWSTRWPGWWSRPSSRSCSAGSPARCGRPEPRSACSPWPRSAGSRRGRCCSARRLVLLAADRPAARRGAPRRRAGAVAGRRLARLRGSDARRLPRPPVGRGGGGGARRPRRRGARPALAGMVPVPALLLAGAGVVLGVRARSRVEPALAGAWRPGSPPTRCSSAAASRPPPASCCPPPGC